MSKADGASARSSGRHLGALLAGTAAMAAVVLAPAGLVGDLAVLAAGVSALLFAWEAATRPGPLRWAAISGALLAGLVTVAAGGIFLVELARALS
ncbi:MULTISPECIES: hypothetical protein [Microbacterium]|uniref:hypothetical protein n=1 Tax=Microbacterium TaxID=33882 RepID=UPI0027892FA1|nr:MULTISPECIES: hypothetical protein [Microbacterium]MDQ1084619.1 hypothetical protein [Microbacterium sp. SORGH_AS_0344]MDQ1170104.1 hypothetical protein [Microbacterium proteolyticum]